MCNYKKQEMNRPMRIFWALLIFGIGVPFLILVFQPGGLDIGKMIKEHMVEKRLKQMKEAGYPLPSLPTASAPPLTSWEGSRDGSRFKGWATFYGPEAIWQSGSYEIAVPAPPAAPPPEAPEETSLGK